MMHSQIKIISILITTLLCAPLVAKDAGDSEEQKTVQPLAERTEQDRQVSRTLAQTCRTEAGQAPTMVMVKPGRFLMGSPDDENGHSDDEGPQHEVTIPKPFAISRCEITVEQFKQFVQDSHYQTTAEESGKGCYVWDSDKKQVEQLPERNWKNPGFEQNADHPVVCVSWDDAQAYAAWLSRRTGATYRLPTEAEWEYAARAGTTAARYYRDDQQCNYANSAGQEAKSIAGSDWMLAECTDGHVYTAPVASYAENHFGLFDMLGNVWEWTQDCWHDNYRNALRDGSAWLEKDGGNCSRRMVRGGSWLNAPQFLRSAFRDGGGTDEAYFNQGFRIARDF